MLPLRNQVTYKIASREDSDGGTVPVADVARMRAMWREGYGPTHIGNATGWSDKAVTRYCAHLPRVEYKSITNQQRDVLLRSWTCNRRIETAWKS